MLTWLALPLSNVTGMARLHVSGEKSPTSPTVMVSLLFVKIIVLKELMFGYVLVSICLEEFE